MNESDAQIILPSSNSLKSQPSQMLSQFYKHWTTAGLILILSLQMSSPALAKKKSTSICEDDLTTRTGLRWGGSRKLPFKRVVDIRECLVDTHLGKVTAGRHGKAQSFQVSELFGGKKPYPGERYFISLWGSKIEGCFVEMIIQDAPETGEVEVANIVPKYLDLGLGGELIQLPAQLSDATKVFKGDYSYTKYVSGANRNYSSHWYMTRNVFAIDGPTLKFLRNAPAGEVKARLTFADDSTQLLKISPETVRSWNEAFGFNPTCEAPEE